MSESKYWQCSCFHPIAIREFRYNSLFWNLRRMESYPFFFACRIAMIVLFLRLSLFCSERMSLFSQRSRELTMHQFIPSSFSSVLVKAFSIYHKCNFTVLLASIWHRMGSESWKTPHPSQAIRSLPSSWWSIWTPHWTYWIHLSSSKSVIIDSVLDWFLRVRAKFWILVFRPWSSSTFFCGTPCTLKSNFMDFPFRTRFFGAWSSLHFFIVLYLPSIHQHNFGMWSRSRNPLIQSLVLSSAYHFLTAVSRHWGISWSFPKLMQ